MNAEGLQIAALLGALWTAVLLYRGERPVRFVAALGLGAVFAHLGWALLHLPAVLEHPWASLDVSRGFSVLFVPIGLLLLAPNASAFATLPLALAVARLGCLAAGCCHGAAGEPVPLAEIGGLVGLHLVIHRLPARWIVPAVLAGIGVVRLATEPWRAAPPLGTPIVPPAVLAALWAAAGLAWGVVSELSRQRRRSPFAKPCARVDRTRVTLRRIAPGMRLRRRNSSAENARDRLTPRIEPLLSALAIMLVVWLLFPLAGLAFGDPTHALLAASAAALFGLLALGGSLRTRVSNGSALVMAAALPVGWLVERALVADSQPQPVNTSAAIAVVALAPAFEELLYRERLLGVLRELWGWLPALLLSSGLFALGHMDPRLMPTAFAGGLVCGAVMLRTDSLAAVIGLHAGWNLGVVAPIG